MGNLMPEGIGIALSRRYYQTVVAPILRDHYPAMQRAACRIGLGSEVLGFDTETSADHDYGPSVQIFVPEAEFATSAGDIMTTLDRHLPTSFEDRTVRYPSYVRAPADGRASGMQGSDHGVELYTVPAWCERYLGRQFAEDLAARDWLSYSEQHFLTVTAGAVFQDDFGEVTALRNRLSYFPRDVWLYKLAAQWGRIAEERAYIGRTGDVGDELGSRVIATRMAGNLMRLALLVERRYAPYPKWFGTAFSRLECAPELGPILLKIMTAPDWREREAAIKLACEFVAELQMMKEVPGATAPVQGSLHNRPFQFVDSLKIFEGLRAAINDQELRQLPEFGGVDQYLSSNFVLAVPGFSEATLTALWQHQ